MVLLACPYRDPVLAHTGQAYSDGESNGNEDDMETAGLLGFLGTKCCASLN